MAVKHIEIHQVAEDQAVGPLLKSCGQFFHAIGVGFGCGVVVYAAAVVDVVDFSDAEDGDCFFGEDVQEHWFGRIDGVVVASGRAGEMADGAFKGPRNYSADAMLAVEKFSGDFAHAVELGDGNYTFVRGNLKNTVAGGVDDGLAGADVFFAELFQDFGAGSGFVAERFTADLLFERVDNLRREPVLVNGKGLIEPDAGHFPVSRGGVFAGGVRCAFAIGGYGNGSGRKILERGNVGEAE